jgi:diaminohydroxyphosphoribosylaminopyrimidine deaminase/5-amino-6-(5-phosphoribosylamino)uracil reductase
MPESSPPATAPAARTTDASFLERAARLALRGHGGAEPNPLVGCLIVSDDGTVVGAGAHRRFGGAHAEVEALRRAGPRARGATAFVTLEPCSHTGKTGPCADALIEAGVGRVVFARRDPGLASGGGAERLRAAGVEVVEIPLPAALAVGEPFARRVTTGLPWVIAKWAQTIDGRVATRDGESQWISGEASRRMVHRERGRVDAILTAVGTVRTDDPMLTARTRRVRRVARRVVIDPGLETPASSRLVSTAREVPTTIFTAEDARAGAAALESAGVEILTAPTGPDGLDLAPILRALVERHDVTTVLVEAGPGLLGRLFRARLVCEAWIFVAPLLLGDEAATPAVRGMRPAALADGVTLEPVGRHVRGDDLVLRYRVGA